ncbi:MAG: HlyD family type I secretion periplasmic adaptor subunit [Elainellaceae cyanobacterium]
MQSQPPIPSGIHARQTQQQLNSEHEYLSYELGKSVKELPPFYTRVLGLGISLFMFGSLTWAYFSKVDEVAIASGQLAPSEALRPVRSLGQGTIQAIHVEPGDRVEAGEILLERDPAITQAEIDRLENSAQLIREDLARLEAERTGAGNTGVALQDQLLAARLQDFETRRAAAIAEANQQLAVIDGAKVGMVRLQESLESARTIHKTAEERVDRIRSLAESGAVSQFAYLDVLDRFTEASQEVNSLEREIEAQYQTIRQAEQAYQAALSTADRLASERQSEVIARLNQRREELTTLEGQLLEARRQQELEFVKSPVSGTVYNVKATTGPIQSGEELLSILPEGEEIVLEVNILNRDIGFVEVGMRTKVKVATFPFQEFGTVEGEVIEISPNAVMDEDLGLVYPAEIKLQQQTIQLPNGGTAQLTPGMVATGEIVTRQKSILAFILEPVVRQLSEAFSVR